MPNKTKKKMSLKRRFIKLGKYIKRTWVMHLVTIILLMGFLTLLSYTFPGFLPHLKSSAEYFWNALVYHLQWMAKMDRTLPEIPLNSLISIDYKSILTRTELFFTILFNPQHWELVFGGMFNLYLVISLLVVIIPIVIIGAIFIRKNYYSQKPGKKLMQESLPLKLWNKTIDSLTPLIIRYRAWMTKYKKFLRKTMFYKVILVIALFVIFNLVSFVLIWLGLVMIIVPSGFNPLVLLSLPLSMIDVILPILVNTHIIIILLGLYILFWWIRIRKAIRMQKTRKEHNMEIARSYPAISIKHAPPGGGKDLVGSQVVQDLEEDLRNNTLLGFLKKYHRLFPNFPFPLMEKDIRNWMENTQLEKNPKDRINNRFKASDKVMQQLRDGIGEAISDFNLKGRMKDIWGYNTDIYPTSVWVGIKEVTLFETLLNYAEAYFMYYIAKPLSVSVIGVHHLYLRTFHDDCFPIYSYDIFGNSDDRKERWKVANFTTNMGWDGFRKGRKMRQKDDEWWHWTDGVITNLPEIDGERGNKNTTVGESKKDSYCNTKTDEVNSTFKRYRHENSLDGVCLGKVIMNTQRLQSLNADLRELADNKIRIVRRNPYQFDLSPFTLEYGICMWIIKKCDDLYLKFREVRRDTTLFMKFLGWISNKVTVFTQTMFNLYAYSEVLLSREVGGNNEEAGIKSLQYYYSLPRQIFADTYRTDSWAMFFKERKLKAKRGFIDRPMHKSINTSREEFEAQESILIGQLNQYDDTTLEEKELQKKADIEKKKQEAKKNKRDFA